MSPKWGRVFSVPAEMGGEEVPAEGQCHLPPSLISPPRPLPSPLMSWCPLDYMSSSAGCPGVPWESRRAPRGEVGSPSSHSQDAGSGRAVGMRAFLCQDCKASPGWKAAACWHRWRLFTSAALPGPWEPGPGTQVCVPQALRGGLAMRDVPGPEHGGDLARSGSVAGQVSGQVTSLWGQVEGVHSKQMSINGCAGQIWTEQQAELTAKGSLQEPVGCLECTVPRLAFVTSPELMTEQGAHEAQQPVNTSWPGHRL